jgi:hypothetical protein
VPEKAKNHLPRPTEILQRHSNFLFVKYEHSEQVRAPHTNESKDVPGVGALSLL